MSKPVRASLPARAVPVMKWLADLSEQDFLALLEKVTNGEAVQSRTQLGDRLQSAIPDVPASRGAELVRELFSLLNLHSTHGWPIDEIVAQISASRSLELTNEQQQVLRRRLVDAASNPLIARLAIAFDAYGEHQNLLHYVRILSDIRPIFDDSSDGRIIGAIVTHTLKLEYHSVSGRQEIYIALDDRDLEDLGDAVARAKRESKSLEEFIVSAGLTDLTPSAE